MIIVIAANPLPREACGMSAQTYTTGQPENQHESTYALLIRSEEKSRNAFEALIYPLLILGPLIAIWQFAQQPVNIPAAGLKKAGSPVLDARGRNHVAKTNLNALRGGRHPGIKG